MQINLQILISELKQRLRKQYNKFK